MPQIAVGVAGVGIVTFNPGRQTISFGNEGLTMLFVSNTILAGLDQAGAPYRLAPGDIMDMSLVIDGKDIRQPWAVISDAAGGVLRWAETAERG